eukprot:g5851.t1
MQQCTGLVETYEVWGMERYSKQNIFNVDRKRQKLNQIIDWLQFLIACCGTIDKPDKEMQLAIMHSDIQTMLDEFLRIPIPKCTEKEAKEAYFYSRNLKSQDSKTSESENNDEKKLSTSELTMRVLSIFNHFLCSWQHDNEEVQEWLYHHIEELLPRMETVPASVDVLIAMFKDNTKLCKNIPQSLFMACANAIHEQPRPTCYYYLEKTWKLLALFCSAEGEDLKDNQIHILRLLQSNGTESGPMSTIYFVNVEDNSSASGFIQFKRLMKMEKPMEHPDVWQHVQLIQLLGHCTSGRIAMAEAICLSLYSYKWQISVIVDYETLWVVRTALLKLFFNCCIDSKTQIVGLATCSYMSKLVSYFRDILHDFVADTRSVETLLNNLSKSESIATTTHLESYVSPTFLDSNKNQLQLELIHNFILPILSFYFDRYRLNFNFSMEPKSITMLRDVGKAIALIHSIASSYSRLMDSKGIKHLASQQLEQSSGICWQAVLKIKILRFRHDVVDRIRNGLTPRSKLSKQIHSKKSPPSLTVKNPLHSQLTRTPMATKRTEEKSDVSSEKDIDSQFVLKKNKVIHRLLGRDAHKEWVERHKSFASVVMDLNSVKLAHMRIGNHWKSADEAFLQWKEALQGNLYLDENLKCRGGAQLIFRRLEKCLSADYKYLIEKIRVRGHKAPYLDVESTIANLFTSMVKQSRASIECSFEDGQFYKTLNGSENLILSTLTILETYVDSFGDQSIVKADRHMMSQSDKNLASQRSIMQDQVNSVGALKLVIDLLSPGVDVEIQGAALRLGCSILSSRINDDAGNEEARENVADYLRQGNSEAFFLNAKVRIKKFMDDKLKLDEKKEILEGYKKEKKRNLNLNHDGDNENEDDNDSEKRDDFANDDDSSLTKGRSGFEAVVARALADDSRDHQRETKLLTLMLRFFQLLCEGHYLPNQQLLLEQKSNDESFNVLQSVAQLFGFIARNNAFQELMMQTVDLLVESVQGPCPKNQRFLSSTTLCDSSNRVLHRLLQHSSDSVNTWLPLQHNIIVLLLGLLEGRTDQMVHRVMLNTLTLNTLLIHLQVVRDITSGLGEFKWRSGKKPNAIEKSALMQHGCDVCVVLLILGDADPEWFKTIVKPALAFKWLQSKMKSIEILWLDKLHQVYFMEPFQYQFVVQESLNTLVKTVDRLNSETKLLGFLEQTKHIYTEMLHQEFIASHKLDAIFSGSNLYLAKDSSFALALLINFILLLTYSNRETFDTDGPGVRLTVEHLGLKQSISDGTLENFLFFLGILQAATSGFILMMFLIVKVPPAYNEYQNPVMVFLNTPTSYYLLYCTCAILGSAGYYWVFSLHLLDIVVRDETTRNVLKAVIQPIYQLAMASVLGIFVMFIFSLIYFLQWPDDFSDGECQYLWSCFFFVFRGGLQGNLADFLKFHQVDVVDWTTRGFLFDMAYFIVINIVLLNIIFGIIIDTFGALRDDQASLREDTLNVCYICSMSRDDFDREGIDFDEHCKRRHNMWNYLRYSIYLNCKDRDTLNGLEQFVYNQIQTGSIDFFPVKRSIEMEKK